MTPMAYWIAALILASLVAVIVFWIRRPRGIDSPRKQTGFPVSVSYFERGLVVHDPASKKFYVLSSELRYVTVDSWSSEPRRAAEVVNRLTFLGRIPEFGKLTHHAVLPYNAVRKFDDSWVIAGVNFLDSTGTYVLMLYEDGTWSKRPAAMRGGEILPA